jgi:hypothetical protein
VFQSVGFTSDVSQSQLTEHGADYGADYGGNYGGLEDLYTSMVGVDELEAALSLDSASVLSVIDWEQVDNIINAEHDATETGGAGV